MSVECEKILKHPIEIVDDLIFIVLKSTMKKMNRVQSILTQKLISIYRFYSPSFFFPTLLNLLKALPLL